MSIRCPMHGRKTWNSCKGYYCWPCENQARQAACEHIYNDKQYMGIVGYRYFCGACGAMYVGRVDDSGDPDVMPEIDTTEDEFDRMMAEGQPVELEER